MPDLRCLAGVLLGLFLLTGPCAARVVTDSAGRTVEVPDHVTRVFAAGPPASTLLYVVAPQKMIGWMRPPSAAEKPFLLPSVRNLPETGRLTGRGNTTNLELLVADKPDLIIDFGTINDTYRSLADRVQSQTGIPYLLIDGRFENTPATLRLLGDILDVHERGEELAQYAEATFAHVAAVVATVPADKRPRVYLARGASGLETGTRGSVNTEIIERVGAVNVVEGLGGRAGIVNVSPEQIIALAPDTIVSLEQSFRDTAFSSQTWQSVPAISQSRVFVAPRLPFGFIDSPPSVNRLIGLTWLLHVLYPAQAMGNLGDEVRSFYHLFYQVDLSDGDFRVIFADERF
jgi:iron complex transport system substrate-binding protein